MVVEEKAMPLSVRGEIRSEIRRWLQAGRDRKPETKSSGQIALLISILGFAVSAGTFYVTQLQPPSIAIYPAPAIGFWSTPEGWDCHLTVAFENRAARGGAVMQSAILIRRVGVGHYYYVKAHSFSELTTGNF